MSRRYLGKTWYALLFGLAALACGEGFDPPSEIKSLRVLAVQKSQPYAAPGEEMTLSMLWADPQQRSIQPVWVGPCVNPASDLYYNCFEQLAKNLAEEEIKKQAGEATEEQSLRHTGDTFPFIVEVKDEQKRGEPPPGNPKYDSFFMFFALCPGQVDFMPSSDPTALPLVCRGADDALLGPDDFVAGYASFYSFPTPGASDPSDVLRNANPEILGFDVDGTPAPSCIGAPSASTNGVAPPCVTDAGQAALEDVNCSDPANPYPCVDSCEDDGDSSCPEITIKPELDPSIAERDDVSRLYFGRDVGEQMWIDYYVDRGSLKSPVRLLNDASTGWNENYGTKFYPPKDPSRPVTLWAVVHDNRGGMNWVRTRIGFRH